MTARPVTLRQPTLAAVMAGRCTTIRRPLRGIYGAVAAGDLLWVREPFRLARQWDKFAPSSAERFGARCYFDADLVGEAAGVAAQLGPTRFARNLLRVWHRQHLVVTSVERRPLKDIRNAEIEAAGYRHRARFIEDWNCGVAIGGGLTWSTNPEVAVIHFRHVPGPAPGLDTRPGSEREAAMREPA